MIQRKTLGALSGRNMVRLSWGEGGLDGGKGEREEELYLRSGGHMLTSGTFTT